MTTQIIEHSNYIPKNNFLRLVGSAAAIWPLADIAYIAIYRDMSKISRYGIAIF